VIGDLNARRGTIIDSEVREDEFTAVAEVALNDMFGYSSQLRGATQGKGEFSMEYKVRFSLHTSLTGLLTMVRIAESYAGAPERAG
jgi:translation elongation factor EF-G